MFPEKIYYEPQVLNYELGRQLRDKFAGVPWTPVESHNNIEELRKNPNREFVRMKRYLILGVRKSLKYTPNEKVSDFLVPYTSSGCRAMCLYCYLVCNFNKCSYLRLFVNREQMLERLMKTAYRSPRDLTFEIGSNSDLVLENTITGNLEWTIENFSTSPKGYITFPTKFDMVENLLHLNHGNRTIMRMSVNPQPIIQRLELGTSSLQGRIKALQQMHLAGYRVGILIAPVVLLDNWKELYSQLIEQLADELSDEIKRDLFIEVIFMTYSYIHRAINSEAFPKAVQLYDKSLMTGRGRGKYCYNADVRQQAEAYLKEILAQKLGGIPIIYIS